MPTTNYIISVLAPDRPGIIASVAAVVFDLRGNIEAMCQTSMQGWFTMAWKASFPKVVGANGYPEGELETRGGLRVVVSPADEGTPAVPRTANRSWPCRRRRQTRHRAAANPVPGREGRQY